MLSQIIQQLREMKAWASSAPWKRQSGAPKAVYHDKEEIYIVPLDDMRPESVKLINTRLIVKMRNNLPLLLKAAEYAIERGFKK